MSHKLKIFVGVVVGLKVVQIAALGATATGGLIADLLQIAASVTGTIVCFTVAGRSRGAARPFWFLLGAALASQVVADVSWAYLQDWHHAAAVHVSPQWDVTLLRTLFLTMLVIRDPESPGLDLGSVVDFVQLAIMYALSFLLVDYMTGMTAQSTAAAEAIWWSMLPRIILVAVTLIQTGRYRSRKMDSLHRGLLLYLAWYLLGEGAVGYLFVAGSLRTGGWLDLGWSVPPLVVALWASAWTPAPEPVKMWRPKPFGDLLLANAPFALAPFVVLLQTMKLGDQFHTARYSLLALSILCFTVRLGFSEFRRHRELESLDRQERTIAKAHDALQEQSAFLEHLIEGAPEAIVISDPELLVRRINGEFTRLFGYTASEAVGRSLTDLILPDDYKLEAQTALQEIRQGRTVSLETIRRHKDGALIAVSSVVSEVSLPRDRKVLCLMYRDIRERRKIEAQLQQSQKMEAVGRLAGGIAHDFNNLLTVINGYGDLLLKRVDELDKIRHPLELIRKAGGQAAQLTQQLLAFSRKQLVQPRRLNLNLLITDSQKMLRRLIGEDVELTLTLRQTSDVLADPGQMQQVLLNLLINARDAMPKGGKVAIDTAHEVVNGKYPGLEAGTRDGTFVVLTVTDTGQGMDAETSQHIFEPFFTTKPAGEGTGLGLATVYAIVQHAGGWIDLHSEPGMGTTFRLYFPVLAGATDHVASPAEIAPQVAGSETILIVEDRDDVREFAKEVLAELGYCVLVASDGRDALAQTQSWTGPLHLLLTDVVMPGTNGAEIAACLRTLRPGIKVLYMSGYPSGVIAGRGTPDLDAELIQKPFTPEILAESVRRTLDR